MKNGLLISCLLLFISCSNNDLNIEKENLIGIWSLSSSSVDSEFRKIITYEFSENGSLEVLNKVEDVMQNRIIGYRYRGIGNYSVNGNTLTINMNAIYLNDDEHVVSSPTIESLELTTDSWTIRVEISLSLFGNSLTFDYGPCNDTVSCVGNQTFFRVQ